MTMFTVTSGVGVMVGDMEQFLCDAHTGNNRVAVWVVRSENDRTIETLITQFNNYDSAKEFARWFASMCGVLGVEHMVGLWS